MDEEASTLALELKVGFLAERGAAEVQHSHRSLLAHLLGTYAFLCAWGARPAVCDAGLFHSVYGTESYSHTTVPRLLRDSVREVIGEEAERLAFLFGVKTAFSFCRLARGIAADYSRWGARTESGDYECSTAQGGHHHLENRLTGEWEPLTTRELVDLVDITVANAIEQTPYLPRAQQEGDRTFLTCISSLALPGASAAVAAAYADRSSPPAGRS